MSTSELTTERLSLRPLGTDDLAWFLNLNRHPEIRRHLWDDREIEESAAVAIIAHSASGSVLSRDRLWVAQQGGEPVGTYGLWTFFAEPQPQLLYVTDPRFARRGFAKEASRTVVSHAFGRLTLPYLDAMADERNVPSIALTRALGFVPHGRREGKAGSQIVLRRWNERHARGHA